MNVSQYQPSIINNNQNTQNQSASFKAGNIHINNKAILPSTAKIIRNNLKANPTYRNFTELFDANLYIDTDISVNGNFRALVDINYKKIDPNKNKLQRFVQKIFQKLTMNPSEQINEISFALPGWSCRLAAEKLSKLLADENFKLYEQLQKIIQDTYI